MKRHIRLATALVAVAILALPRPGRAQIWTDWTGATSGCSAGTIACSVAGTFNGVLNGDAVTLTANFNAVNATACNDGTQGSQLSTGDLCDYWTTPDGSAYTQHGLSAPDNAGMVQFNSPVTGTIIFASPVLNPYIAFISVGQTGDAVTYTFTSGGNPVPLTVQSNDSTHCAHWGCGSYSVGPNSVDGTEFSGTVELHGIYSEIDFTTTPDEYWHAITLGVESVNPSVTPEPMTMSLMAMGLVGLGGAQLRRRRNNKA
jgi:hypothetical protein